jgi:SAM-dependent MidA family methyltransferase
LDSVELEWARRWWPGDQAERGTRELGGRELGGRVELGGPRDDAWAAAVATVHRGLALTVDYGHTREGRPPVGTLTGFASGRQVHPVPDGSMDVTAHVAIDAVGAAGEAVAGEAATLTTQRAALRALGLRGDRPSRALSTEDPARYVAALAEASRAGVLMDPAGLGGQYWLLQPVGVALPVLSRMAA